MAPMGKIAHALNRHNQGCDLDRGISVSRRSRDVVSVLEQYVSVSAQ